MSEIDWTYGGFFNDDGTPIDPNLVPKPALCVMCKKGDEYGTEEWMLCTLTRAGYRDHAEGEEFQCGGFEDKR